MRPTSFAAPWPRPIRQPQLQKYNARMHQTTKPIGGPGSSKHSTRVNDEVVCGGGWRVGMGDRIATAHYSQCALVVHNTTDMELKKKKNYCEKSLLLLVPKRPRQ